MPKEIGPREKALREQRERNFEASRPTPDQLRAKVASIPKTKARKAKKGKRR